MFICICTKKICSKPVAHSLRKSLLICSASIKEIAQFCIQQGSHPRHERPYDTETAAKLKIATSLRSEALANAANGTRHTRIKS